MAGPAAKLKTRSWENGVAAGRSWSWFLVEQVIEMGLGVNWVLVEVDLKIWGLGFLRKRDWEMAADIAIVFAGGWWWW